MSYDFVGKVRLFDTFVRGEFFQFSPNGMKICQTKLVYRNCAIMRWKPGIYLTWNWTGTGTWKTPRQMDGQNYDS